MISFAAMSNVSGAEIKKVLRMSESEWDNFLDADKSTTPLRVYQNLDNKLEEIMYNRDTRYPVKLRTKDLYAGVR